MKVTNFHNKLECFVPDQLFQHSLTNTQAIMKTRNWWQ